MKRSTAIAFMVAMLLVGACGTTAESPGPPTPTDEAASVIEQPVVDAALVAQVCQFGAVVFDVGPVALCAKAIALATARLGVLHLPITSISFRLDMCPPNARCRAPNLDAGWVIFTFAGGNPAMIHVEPLQNLGGPTETLVAGPPQPLPQWLLEQMAGRLH